MIRQAVKVALVAAVLCVLPTDSQAQVTGRAVTSAAPPVSSSSLSKLRWIADAYSIDLQALKKDKDKKWCIVDFLPNYPGKDVREMKGTKDPVTGAVVVTGPRYPFPIVSGKYRVLDVLTGGPDAREGLYKFKSPLPTVTFRYLERDLATLDPLVQGGVCLTCINSAADGLDASVFSPRFAIPKEWEPDLVAAFRLNKTDENAQTNVFFRLQDFKQKLQANLSNPREATAVLDLIQQATGLEKGIMVAALALRERPNPVSLENTAFKERAVDIVNGSSTEDLIDMLQGLKLVQEAPALNPNFYKTGNFAPALFSATMDRVEKLPSTPGNDWLKSSVKEFPFTSPPQ